MGRLGSTSSRSWTKSSTWKNSSRSDTTLPCGRLHFPKIDPSRCLAWPEIALKLVREINTLNVSIHELPPPKRRLSFLNLTCETMRFMRGAQARLALATFSSLMSVPHSARRERTFAPNSSSTRSTAAHLRVAIRRSIRHRSYDSRSSNVVAGAGAFAGGHAAP